MDDCIFCKIISGELPSEKVFESENFIVVKNINPAVSGHLLIISKKHYANFIEMPQELYSEMMKSAKGVVGKLRAEDFNLVINNGKSAGQLVNHFHLHILPRKNDDGFKLGI